MAISFQGGTLYKKTSGGKLQYWKIFSRVNEIVTQYGQVGGKEQETVDVIKEGKNEGRSNATTAEQQAYREAQARWTKQLKKGYVKTEAEALAGVVDEVVAGGISPMLAHRFDEQGHKIVYPALAQPKFDGHRCIAIIDANGCTLWSRTRKPITAVPHIQRALEKLVPMHSSRSAIVLDGELYNHDYKDKFEELTSFLRQVEPKPGHEVVEYHIYDTAGLETQKSRLTTLEMLFNGEQRHGPLVRVETLDVESEDDLMAAFERFLSQGYEGLMVRNAGGHYENKRSYGLQKVKEFASAEYKVVGVEEGRGKMAGHAIFVCWTADGTPFRAKMKGEIAELKKYFDDPGLAIGRLLEVKYQGLTNKSQVPRFPVGMRFRDDL